MRFHRFRTTRWMLGVLLGSALSCLPSWGHHSIAGVYDTRRDITVEASVTEFHFVNPHPFLVVNVADSDEGPQVWYLDMDNRRELSAVGMTEQTFRPGERIVVRGNPSRVEDRRLYIRRLDRPGDGFIYEQVGTRPRIRPSSQ